MGIVTALVFVEVGRFTFEVSEHIEERLVVGGMIKVGRSCGQKAGCVTVDEVGGREPQPEEKRTKSVMKYLPPCLESWCMVKTIPPHAPNELPGKFVANLAERKEHNPPPYTPLGNNVVSMDYLNS